MQRWAEMDYLFKYQSGGGTIVLRVTFQECIFEKLYRVYVKLTRSVVYSQLRTSDQQVKSVES